MSKPTAEIEDVECVKDTGKALLCRVPVPGQKKPKEVWIPQSVVHADSEVFDDDGNSKGKLVVEEWFAVKEGLV